MKRTDQCPECGSVLSHKSYCTCGWFISGKPTPTAIVDYRCVYKALGRRCVLPGTICTSPYGKSSPWYCSGHWQSLDDPELGEAILLEGEKNFEKMLQERMDWRRKLFTFLKDKKK